MNSDVEVCWYWPKRVLLQRTQSDNWECLSSDAHSFNYDLMSSLYCFMTVCSLAVNHIVQYSLSIRPLCNVLKVWNSYIWPDGSKISLQFSTAARVWNIKLVGVILLYHSTKTLPAWYYILQLLITSMTFSITHQLHNHQGSKSYHQRLQSELPCLKYLISARKGRGLITQGDWWDKYFSLWLLYSSSAASAFFVLDIECIRWCLQIFWQTCIRIIFLFSCYST